MRTFVTAADLFLIHWIEDVRISPSGGKCAVTITRLDQATDGRDTLVAWMKVGQPPPRTVPLDAQPGRHPRWAPGDDLLAFLGPRADSTQILLLDTAAGTVRQLTNAPTGVTAFDWSPDGTHIVYASARPRTPIGLLAIRPQPWKIDGVGYLSEPTSHELWLVEVSTGFTIRISADPVSITHVSWSPDGQRIAYCAHPIVDGRTTLESELRIQEMTGDSSPSVVWDQGPIRALAWSPLGDSVALIAHDRGRAQGVNFGVWLVDVAAAGAPLNLTAHTDSSFGMPTKSDQPSPPSAPDLYMSAFGDSIFALMLTEGVSKIAEIGLDGSVAPLSSGHECWISFSISKTGAIAGVAASAQDPGEAYLLEGSATPRPLTQLNLNWSRERTLGDLEEIWIDTVDGVRLQGWIQHPARHRRDDALPMILYIHGGPHWAMGPRFNLDLRRVAELGYRVAYVNPRGSQGYGEAFAQANVGDWGGVDAADLETAVLTLSMRSDIDRSRLGVVGESYGGYMVSWLASTTDVFDAVICQNGISDLRTEFLTTADPRLLEWDFSGPPWSRPTSYVERSPLGRVTEIRAPILLVHSELDQVCPISQSEALFTALRLLGRDAYLLVLADEGHLVNLIGRPSSIIRRMQETETFLRHHLASS